MIYPWNVLAAWVAGAARSLAVPVTMAVAVVAMPAHAGEVRMFASNAVKEVLLELKPVIER